MFAIQLRFFNIIVEWETGSQFSFLIEEKCTFIVRKSQCNWIRSLIKILLFF